jgi:hypothetical protein
MPDYISRQMLKIKALERWENEGGRIFADQTVIIQNGLTNKRADEVNSARIFESLPADKLIKGDGDEP